MLHVSVSSLESEPGEVAQLRVCGGVDEDEVVPGAPGEAAVRDVQQVDRRQLQVLMGACKYVGINMGCDIVFCEFWAIDSILENGGEGIHELEGVG